MRFFTELKRRKVVRVAVVYAATGFVVLQAADLILPRLGVPEWGMSLIVVLVLLGLPIALVLGWALELTPEGVRVTSAGPVGNVGREATPPLLGHRTLLAAAALVVLGVGLGAGLVLRPVGEPTRDGDAFLPVDPAATGAEARSLAVLPFSDLSESGDQKWFADGLAEEILVSLARLPELRVIGRSSSFQLAAEAGDDRSIAGALGVAHLVKGSVRRAGERIRVTAQLVRADDAVQLWSHSYDRHAADLLDVQRDVAEKVAAALDVLLDDARRERMFAAGTRDVEAFEAFLRGRELYYTAHTGGATLVEANQWLGRAMELDSGFGLAALLHSDRWAHLVLEGPGERTGTDVSAVAALEFLHRDLERAARAAPDSLERALVEINRVLFSSSWHRLPGLVSSLRRNAQHGMPKSDDPYGGLVLIITGDVDLARELVEQRVRAEPLEPSVWGERVAVEIAAGNTAPARQLLAESLQAVGEHRWRRDAEITLLLLGGEREALLTLLEGSSGQDAALRAAIRGDTAAALSWARRVEAASEWPRPHLLLLYHQLGDAERSRALVSRIDALPAGAAMLALEIGNRGRSLTFDLADAPTLSARLAEAGVDPGSFRVMPRLVPDARVEGR